MFRAFLKYQMIANLHKLTKKGKVQQIGSTNFQRSKQKATNTWHKPTETSRANLCP